MIDSLRPSRLLLRSTSAFAVTCLLTGSLVFSCTGDPLSTSGGSSNAPDSQSMSQWTPATQDTCSQALHDSYFVIGPDGKKYPTWHPPETTDPATGQTCSFGHEHGTNPAGSALWPALQQHFGFDANHNGTLDTSELAVSGIPFGLVSEQLVGSATPRIEDHTAYKIAFVNSAPRSLVSGALAPGFDLSCDLFVAYNQATSTADAFASNMFSVIYAVNCNAGASVQLYPVNVIVSTMAVYGAPGSFMRADGTLQENTGLPVPDPSPPGGTERGRIIPTSDQVLAGAFVLAGQTSTLAPLTERWETQLRLRRSDGSELATLNPAVVVKNPARYFDLGSNALAQSIALCYSGLDANGALVTDPLQASTIVRQVRGSAACSAIAPNGPATTQDQRVAFDDPASPFNACVRSAFFGADVVHNVQGPLYWYTDAFGANANPVAFANSIRQFVSTTDTGSVVLAAVETDQPFCQSTKVHVPN
ncbi:MAG TPA: hypothetical protein VMG60_12405 [Burkholderiaceae bacterium]|nr:hypothetical protein [Burkholderiaceae bacterium]